MVRPHAKHANNALFAEDFIHEPIVDVDPPRVGSGEVTNKLTRTLLDAPHGSSTSINPSLIAHLTSAAMSLKPSLAMSRLR